MAIKAVIDTNVWISSLLASGPPRAIVQALARNEFTLITADELVDEFVRVASREKFAALITKENAEVLLLMIEEKAIYTNVSAVPALSRDPKDDVYLACAKAANADYLVTGDRDLLVLKEHSGTRIVTPAEFLDVLTA